jgi:hypothetical protein
VPSEMAELSCGKPLGVRNVWLGRGCCHVVTSVLVTPHWCLYVPYIIRFLLHHTGVYMYHIRFLLHHTGVYMYHIRFLLHHTGVYMYHILYDSYKKTAIISLNVIKPAGVLYEVGSERL